MLKKEKIISVLVTFVLIFISHELIKSNNYYIESNVDKLSNEVLNLQASVLEKTISKSTNSATILGEYVELESENITTEKFNQFAEVLLDKLRGVANLQLAPDAIVQTIYPLKGNEKAIGHNLFKDNARKKEAFLTKKSHKLTLAGPFKLLQGGVGMVARKPVYINGKFWGFVSALVTLDGLVKSTNLYELRDKEFIYRLRRLHPDTNKMDIFYGDKSFSKDNKIYTKSIKVPNGLWFLDIQYTGTYISNVSIAFLYIIGFLISILLGYLLFIVLNRPRELLKANDLLENKVKEQTKKIQGNLDLISKYVLYTRTNKDGIIIEASDAFCDLSGYTKEELIGKDEKILRDPSYQEDFYVNVKKTLINEKFWNGEFKNRAKQGHIYWVNTVITPEYSDSEELIGFISIKHDVSAKKSFEEHQFEYFQNAKMVAMGEMVGNIAHQWRQPLSAISTLASGIILERKANIISEEEMYLKLGSIVQTTIHLSKTIDTFRDFLKVQKTLDVVTLEDKISASLLIINATLKEKLINFIDNIDYTKKVKVKLISGQLEQVLLNIFNNAKDVLIEKNIKNPWIKLDLEVEDDKAIISVEDNGGGIKPNIMPHIFEPYFTTKHQTLGTGLGLNMSYRIVCESLSGNIYAKNTEYGAKFFIELDIVS